MKNKKTRIDWMVLAETEHENDRNNPEAIVDCRTEGFEKHGFGGEVLVVGKVKNVNRIANLINTFCKLMISGEDFEPGIVHYIDGKDGVNQFKFHLIRYSTLNNGIKYQLIPIASEPYEMD